MRLKVKDAISVLEKIFIACCKGMNSYAGISY